jgi:hypothetical protein
MDGCGALWIGIRAAGTGVGRDWKLRDGAGETRDGWIGTGAGATRLGAGPEYERTGGGGLICGILRTFNWAAGAADLG